MKVKLRCPLEWPLGWPRTSSPKDSRFHREGRPHSFASIRPLIEREVGLMGGEDAVLTTNLPLTLSGNPARGRRDPDDPGVALYFSYDGSEVCLPCDTFNRIGCNARAIQLSLESLRALKRYGCEMVLANLIGKGLALPPAGGSTVNDSPALVHIRSEFNGLSDPEALKRKFRALAKIYHPDHGGAAQAWIELQREYQTLLGS